MIAMGHSRDWRGIKSFHYGKTNQPEPQTPVTVCMRLCDPFPFEFGLGSLVKTTDLYLVHSTVNSYPFNKIMSQLCLCH